MSRCPPLSPLISRPCGALTGGIAVPGDKSISHRALIVAALGVGETRIAGLLESDDVMATLAAVRALGAEIERDGTSWRVLGCGVGGLAEPSTVLDLGNSGTGARLLMGVTAAHGFTSVFSGDASLCRRPMRRVVEPLERMGARFQTRSGCRLPLAVAGVGEPLAITYTLPVASAQVKSAVLLAGLQALGTTTVIEPQPSRDHTERMLSAFGASIRVDVGAGGERSIVLAGQPELAGCPVEVPGDPSSAAFPIVAALVLPGSRLTVSGVGANPLRIGLITTLQEMGASVAIRPRGVAGGEPVADIEVAAGHLHGVRVPAERVPSMIDEFPALAVAAACAEGATRLEGLGELRVKESDRLAAIARGLAACGVGVEEGGDWLVVHGVGGRPPGGATVESHLDHRIAMAFLVLGAAARAPVRVDDGSMITTSFPGFAATMNVVGADIGADPS